MSPRSALFALFIATLPKVGGGAVLLWTLNAPGWAIAAWLMFHVKFSLRLPAKREDR
jgi:hypothetical protein